MNRSEHILTCLSEEGIEVAKEISKALRFGLEDKLTLDPDGPRGTTGQSNRDKIRDEFIDMLGAYQKCVSEGIMPDLGLEILDSPIRDRMITKGQRIESYMRHAKRVGSLENAPSLNITSKL